MKWVIFSTDLTVRGSKVLIVGVYTRKIVKDKFITDI